MYIYIQGICIKYYKVGTCLHASYVSDSKLICHTLSPQPWRKHRSCAWSSTAWVSWFTGDVRLKGDTLCIYIYIYTYT